MSATTKDRAPDEAPALTLRPARPEDDEFLRAVYASTRAVELAVVPWTEAQRAAFINMQYDAQQHDYRSRFPAAAHNVVLRDGRPVGRLLVARTAEEIRILDLTILPAQRSAGIGTALLRDLQAEAQALSLPLRIYVESFNPALSLFARLGFARVAEQGAHYLLEWRAGDNTHSL